MDRRFSSFLLASTAFFLIYMSLRTMFVPPQPIALPPEPDAVAEVEPAEIDIASSDAIETASDGEDTDEPITRPESPQWRTLGSMDPASGHLMLVTLNSRGAGIERIEVTERKKNGRLKYRRVDVRSGYMGYLAADATATTDGVVVNVVGPGTPIDNAVSKAANVPNGLKPGDKIVAINGVTVSNIVMLENWLDGTKPDDLVTLDVIRGQGSIVQFDVTLTEHPLDLVRLADTAGDDQIAGNLSRLSSLLTVSKVGRREIAPGERTIASLTDPTRLIWNINEEGENAADSGKAQTLSFEVQLSEKEMQAVGGHAIGLQRSYTLTPGSFVLDMDVQIDNRAEEAQELAYRLEGINGVTLEGWWYSNKISPNWGGSAARDLVYQTTAEGHELVSGYGLLKRARNETTPDDQNLFAPDSQAPERDLSYIGIDAQYFTVAYLPQEGKETLNTYRRAIASLAADPDAIPKNKERAVNTTFYLDSAVVEVPAGSSLKQSLRLFAGPKQPDLFAHYGLEDCIYYGWFSWPAKLLGRLLHVLSGVGNYALAIFLLTVIVRGAMFPLSRKAAVNAQRMQELAPELKKISEQYKDDMEGRVRAQRELQQRVGFNPMSGCLPMFLQLPIFIGLYRTLSVDIELRQAAFASWTTWASNLAAPDMLYYWGDWMWDYMAGRGTGWLGPYFNILPVIVMGLFLAQQKLFMPPATDEQTAMTQKMMSYMTLIMGLFFFRVPAGLCIYFITSSIWGIGERILVKKTLPKSPHFDKAVLEGKVNHRGGGGGDGKGPGGELVTPKKPVNSPTGSGGGESWADRLRQRMNPEEPAAPLPRDRKRPKPNKKRN
ncbi:YidC/Oxa1 family insertase periplasmic-domain containing protein [Aporhodopirellula aestuarii]|uniref:Membrane protein insertase YidC n=1 Tax=Aporhodopirellula aestuarii TaxID=2950107 RepID=A0ABT0U856_9BACT|nr:YidC/Oxa1 family insertase periplasmic-domain containing protein [Aporhodopirellula aestuarii]MCM2372966.1 YidC/Oxa1 family insertase periplasmic-domain containing protein [Aporhodopirellula aestuarii]